MLILPKQIKVEALDKIFLKTDWITIFFVLLLGVLFFLKGLDAVKLKGYAFALFNKSFVESETEENTSFLKIFHVLIFIYSVTILSLVSYYFFIHYSERKIEGLYLFWIIFLSVFSYFVLKWGLEYLFSLVFGIQKQIKFFLFSKSSYLYSISFFLLISLILVAYTKLNVTFLICFTLLLFLVRFSFHVISNKNLIFNKLFYFILYLCAFEIAPLFIAFKLMF